jgi:integrase/recombinase XerC
MNARDQAWLTRFDTHLATERRMAPSTRYHYAREVRSLIDWVDTKEIGDIANMDSRMIRDFIADSHRGGLSTRSLRRRLSAVRGFFAFLVREGLLANNPAEVVAMPRAARHLPRLLDVDRVNRLLDAPATPAPPAGTAHTLRQRDLAIFELMYSSGLRLAETVALNLLDLDLEQGLVRVLGKGARERAVPVGRKAAEALTRWLALRSALADADESALFIGVRGARLTMRSVQKRLTVLALSSGLDVHVHPHMLRHAFASHLLESSGDLRAVQELLGHADIGTTQIYTHLDFNHLADVHERAHPRARRRNGSP